MNRGKYHNRDIEKMSRKEIRQIQNERLRW